MVMHYDAILFDLLTALLDSWTLWDTIAGGLERGRIWRHAYLRLTYGANEYRNYRSLIAKAAEQVCYPAVYTEQLIERWDELQPWPGVIGTLDRLRPHVRMSVVTNCSEDLAHRAAKQAGNFDVIVSAQRAGFYKPHERPYRLALEELGVDARRTLFVAGSAFDLVGAARVGMPVFWHNHIGMTAPQGTPLPLAEHREFESLFGFVVGDSCGINVS